MKDILSKFKQDFTEKLNNNSFLTAPDKATVLREFESQFSELEKATEGSITNDNILSKLQEVVKSELKEAANNSQLMNPQGRRIHPGAIAHAEKIKGTIK